MSAWINVRDCKIPREELVLISYLVNEDGDRKVNAGVDIFGDGLFKCFSPNGINNVWVSVHHISHWMPMPEPPK